MLRQAGPSPAPFCGMCRGLQRSHCVASYLDPEAAVNSLGFKIPCLTWPAAHSLCSPIAGPLLYKGVPTVTSRATQATLELNWAGMTFVVAHGTESPREGSSYQVRASESTKKVLRRSLKKKKVHLTSCPTCTLYGYECCLRCWGSGNDEHNE